MAIRILHATQTMASGGAATGIRNIIASLNSPQFEHLILVENLSEAERIATPNVAKLYAIPPCPWRLWMQKLQTIRGFLNEQQINIVHGRGWPGTDALVAATAIPSVGLVFSGHGRPTAQAVSRTFLQRILLRWLGTHLHRAFAVTPELADELAQSVGWPRKKVEVIFNMVDMSRFVPKFYSPQKADVNPFRIGVAGRLVQVKRIDLVLKMAQQIMTRLGTHAFIIEIAGDGPLYDKLEADIKHYGLEKSVLLIGKITHMPDWYQSLDVFVSTSDFEGCSNVIMEAMASAVPVIATDVGVNRMLIGDDLGGFIIPIGDSDSLIQRVLTCIDNPGLTLSLGQAGRKRLEEVLSIENYKKAHVQLYEGAIHDCFQPS